MQMDTIPDGSNKKGFESTGFTHIAFEVAEKREVDDIVKRLMADGITITGEPRMTGDGIMKLSCWIQTETVLKLLSHRNKRRIIDENWPLAGKCLCQQRLLIQRKAIKGYQHACDEYSHKNIKQKR